VSGNNYIFLKRLIDVFFSAAMLILLAPFLLLIAICVRTKLGSPIFFVQERPGLNARPFNLIKFRTMLDAVDENGVPLPDDERLTPFGKFLRSSSIDELPEFWNILRGDMSLVGPRPLLTQYLPLYSPSQARRHEIRPGITGWAQVNGRNLLSWEEKFDLDIWYLNNRSMFLDIKILLLTVKEVFQRSGISSENHATMPPFKGSGD
jgi:lipopolysaccharide/colanic/teichoic acid biosynthesis glycosyltransferase